MAKKRQNENEMSCRGGDAKGSEGENGKTGSEQKEGGFCREKVGQVRVSGGQKDAVTEGGKYFSYTCSAQTHNPVSTEMS